MGSGVQESPLSTNKNQNQKGISSVIRDLTF